MAVTTFLSVTAQTLFNLFYNIKLPFRYFGHVGNLELHYKICIRIGLYIIEKAKYIICIKPHRLNYHMRVSPIFLVRPGRVFEKQEKF